MNLGIDSFSGFGLIESSLSGLGFGFSVNKEEKSGSIAAPISSVSAGARMKTRPSTEKFE